jgi:hypothetical protein
MKNLNSKKESWKSLLIFVTLVFAVTAPLIGCGTDKKSGTQATAPDPGPGGNCSACGGYTNKITSALNRSVQGDVELAFELFSVSGSPATYNGAVVMAGYMEVIFSPIGLCTLPPGFYDLRVVGPSGTYAPDEMSVFNLTNMHVEAVHQDGRVAQLHIPYMEIQDDISIIGADGYEYQNSFFGEVHITSFPGMNCGYRGFIGF